MRLNRTKPVEVPTHTHSTLSPLPHRLTTHIQDHLQSSLLPLHIHLYRCRRPRSLCRCHGLVTVTYALPRNASFDSKRPRTHSSPVTTGAINTSQNSQLLWRHRPPHHYDPETHDCTQRRHTHTQTLLPFAYLATVASRAKANSGSSYVEISWRSYRQLAWHYTEPRLLHLQHLGSSP